MKPHIYRERGLWICVARDGDDSDFGWGHTMGDAHWRWRTSYGRATAEQLTIADRVKRARIRAQERLPK